MCFTDDHAFKGHQIIDITTIQQVKISDVKEYETKLGFKTFLAVSYDNSIWIGDGEEEEGFHLFASHTALQNVKLVGDKVKIISSFNMTVCNVAATPNNDILIATGKPTLKQIKVGSTKVIDSPFFVKQCDLKTVHVTKDGRVIVGGLKCVVAMDADGNHLTRYGEDKNYQEMFSEVITSITSTTNGNIFVTGKYENRVLVFRNTDVISIYRGYPKMYYSNRKEFSPSSLVTTPMDNVIVADFFSNALHILNDTGHLLTTYNTKEIVNMVMPQHLAITTEGSSTVLFMTCLGSNNLYKMFLTGC